MSRTEVGKDIFLQSPRRQHHGVVCAPFNSFPSTATQRLALVLRGPLLDDGDIHSQHCQIAAKRLSRQYRQASNELRHLQPSLTNYDKSQSKKDRKLWFVASHTRIIIII